MVHCPLNNLAGEHKGLFDAELSLSSRSGTLEMRLLCLIRVRLSFLFFFKERLQDNQSLLLDA